MGATANLSSSALVVAPGGEASCEVTVRNTSSVVEEMTFEVLGPVAHLARVEPARLSLFPATEGKVTLTFAPPRDTSTPAGVFDFAIKVNPKEDPEGTCVEEGTVEIHAFDESFLELTPRTGHGRLTGRYEAAVDNLGNAPLQATLSGANEEQQLKFSFSPPVVATQPGQAAFSKLEVKPRKRMWRGVPKSHPFTVTADDSTGRSLKAEGVFVQEPVLPRWLFRLLMALVALALILVLLWFTVLKPSIKSQARNAAQSEIAASVTPALQQGALVDANGNPTGNVAVNPDTGAAGKATATTKPGGEGGDGSGGAGGAGGKAVFSKRLTAKVASGQTGSATFPVPDGQTLSMTDIVFQNPFADSGLLRVKKNGDTLMELNLDFFRDLDYHFVTGTPFGSGDKLVLEVDCRNTDRECNPSVYITGETTASATTTTKP